MTESKNILSIYFDTQRTYICGISQTSDINDLIFIESTANPICFSSLLDGINDKGKEDLLSVISKIDFQPEKLIVCLTPDNFVMTRIPFIDNMEGNELKDLIELEVKYNFENMNIFDLNCILTPFFDDGKYSNYINLTLYEKLLEKRLEELFSTLQLKPHIRINNFSVLNSYVYNYPELIKHNSILFGIEESRLYCSLFVGKRPNFIQSIVYEVESELPEICAGEMKNISENYEIENVNILIYGGSLTADSFRNIKSKFPEHSVYRFNTFRQLTSQLDQRTVEYCSRTSHIYPSCIGAALTDVIEHIRLFGDENN